MSMLGMELAGGEELARMLGNLAAVEKSPELMKAMHDGAEKVAGAARDNLDRMVYSQPLPAGAERTGELKEKTKPLGNYRVKDDKVITTVGTGDFRAQFVHFGTGVHGKAKGGRTEPWVYEGRDGEYYTTEGQEPKPYLTDALKKTRTEYMSLLMSAILTIPKNPT